MTDRRKKKKKKEKKRKKQNQLFQLVCPAKTQNAVHLFFFSFATLKRRRTTGGSGRLISLQWNFVHAHISMFLPRQGQLIDKKGDCQTEGIARAEADVSVSRSSNARLLNSLYICALKFWTKNATKTGAKHQYHGHHLRAPW